MQSQVAGGQVMLEEENGAAGLGWKLLRAGGKYPVKGDWVGEFKVGDGGKNKIRVTETLSHWKPVLYVSEKEKERVKPGMSSPVSLCLTAGPGPHKMPQLLWSDSAGQLAQSSARNSLQALCYVPFLFLLLFLK